MKLKIVIFDELIVMNSIFRIQSVYSQRMFSSILSLNLINIKNTLFMLDFQNNALNIDDLPRFETVEGHPVAPAYLKVLRIIYAFWVIVLIGVLIVLKFKSNPPAPFYYTLIGVLTFVFSLLIIEIEKGFQKRKFGIREKDIIFQKGFFVFKETIVPYKRIQHVEVKQTLVFKIFKLFTLKVYTAGSSAGDLSIKGLNQDDADKIKAQILKVADIDEN